MPVIQQTTYAQATGNGVTTVYPFLFLTLLKTDLSVYVDDVLKTVDADYTVSGLGVITGGSITFLVAPANATVVSIVRTMTRTRSTDYQTLGDFATTTVNPDFDRPILIEQDIDVQLGRSIRTPSSEVATLMTLPTKALRAGKYIAMDSNGQPVASVGTGNDTALRTDLASGVAGLVKSTAVTYIRTAAEIAAGVTPTAYQYAPVGQENADVKRTGAIGDGVTSDTVAFSNMLSILGNAVVNACRTAASYLLGAINLTLAPNLQGGGKITLSGANAGFKLDTNMAGAAFRDLEVVGDGVVGNLHRMVWNDGTKTISGMKIVGVYVHGCVQNIDISYTTDGSVIGCRLDSAAGSAAGQGYGLVGSKSKRIAILGNTLYANGRHSIYQSSVNYNVVLGNIAYQNAGTGSSSAFPITRLATGMAVVGNIAAEYVGTGMSIDADNADGNGTCRAIQVVGHVFYQAPGSTNTNSDLAIGSSVPATNPLQTIAVRTCSFTPSPVRQNGFIVVTNGLNLDLSDNIFDAYLGTVANYIGINLDASAGAAYYDRIRICGNTGVIVSSGGATTFVNVGTNICTGTQYLDIFNNTVTCGALISYATTPTNPNIRTDSLQEQAITLALGAQNLNIAGYNRFTITGNGGGSSVTNIVNGYEGKIITLEFNDALTTLARGNQYLSGSVNFVSVNRAIMVLQLRGANWHELSRSLNG